MESQFSDELYQRFRDLLAKYDENYQKATDAYIRGEEAPHVGGSDNTM